MEAPRWRPLLLLLLLTIVQAFRTTPNETTIAVIPHDIHPGYSVRKLSSEPSEYGLNYRLLETGFSQFFTVLEDGLVMTTSNLTPLVNRPVNLVVIEETPNTTETHTLQLYVLDRRDMLRFPKAVYEDGKVLENAPIGTRVANIPDLLAAGAGVGGLPVRYAIVSGNENGAFSLLSNGPKKGVRLVTARPLDREKTSQYTLTVQASDARGIDKARTNVQVRILDENDNSPVFKQRVYRFSIQAGNATRRFSAVGAVHAIDADGDHIAYKLASPSNVVVIVPQTGDLLLAQEPMTNNGEDLEYGLSVEAHDLRSPSRASEVPAQVWLQFNTIDDEENEVLITSNEVDGNLLHRDKRRVTRAVRPTKRTEFTEADGETEGRVVFQLEKETERETFKIRDENSWVTVEPNGAVRVKRKWDYEELGPEKTIDFWVTITNAGGGGRSYFISICRLKTNFSISDQTDECL